MTARKLLIALVVLYQRAVSPFFGSCCRFHPSCSRYAVDAINARGILRGLWLALKRILKCNPFHPGGYDPVKL